MAVFAGGSLWASPAGASTTGSGNTGGPPASGYVTPTTSPGEAQARAEAAQLSQQIEAQGQKLDQLAEAYNGAQIHLTAVNTKVRGTQAAVVSTGRKVTSATTTVRNQAIAAYIGQPQPSLTGLKVDPNEGDALAATYVESVGDLEKQSIDKLKQLRHTQTVQLASLHRQQKQATDALTTLQAAQSKAKQAQQAQEALLGQVQGQLAVYVAADQRQQQQAAEAALAAQEATSTTSAPPTTPATQAPNTTAAAPPSTETVAAAAPTTASPAAAPTTQYVAPTTRYVAPTTRYVPPTTQYVPPPTTAPPAPSAPAGPPPGVSAAIAFAESQIGKPYVFGGAGPNGWDCSGLVMVAFEQIGIYFPHYAESQYADTARISISQLEPGDLVFFSDAGQMDHVGIYIGGGQMVDAPSTGHDVRIESIYWSNLAGAGRVR